MMSYLIEDFYGKSLSTLAALERFLSVVKSLVVLLEVAQPIKHLVALVAPVLPHAVRPRHVGGRGQVRGRGSAAPDSAFEAVGGRGRRAGGLAHPLLEVGRRDRQLVEIVLDAAPAALAHRGGDVANITVSAPGSGGGHGRGRLIHHARGRVSCPAPAVRVAVVGHGSAIVSVIREGRRRVHVGGGHAPHPAPEVGRPAHHGIAPGMTPRVSPGVARVGRRHAAHSANGVRGVEVGVVSVRSAHSQHLLLLLLLLLLNLVQLLLLARLQAGRGVNKITAARAAVAVAVDMTKRGRVLHRGEGAHWRGASHS